MRTHKKNVVSIGRRASVSRAAHADEWPTQCKVGNRSPLVSRHKLREMAPRARAALTTLPCSWLTSTRQVALPPPPGTLLLDIASREQLELFENPELKWGQYSEVCGVIVATDKDVLQSGHANWRRTRALSVQLRSGRESKKSLGLFDLMPLARSLQRLGRNQTRASGVFRRGVMMTTWTFVGGAVARIRST